MSDSNYNEQQEILPNPMSRTLRLASRRSKMALFQTNWVIDQLKQADPTLKCEIVEVIAKGDYDQFKGDLKQIGGKGAFVKSLEQAILNGEADMAVHSMKDVPTDEELPEGLIISSILERSDMRDVAVCRKGESFVGLKEGAKVGTSSVRRGAQLRAAFPHLDIVPYRGNATTRLEKLDNGDVDCAILAKAGLERIGHADRITEVFEPDMMCPSAGQGAVGVECRADDAELLTLLEKINHQDSFTCVMAERELLKTLGGCCHTPIGCYCVLTETGDLHLIGMVASIDGSKTVWARATLPYADHIALGRQVGEDLLSQGAEEMIALCNQAA